MQVHKKSLTVICAIFLFLLLMAVGPDDSVAIVGLTGSTWGEITYDYGDSATGSSAMGYIKQGIDWVEIKHYRLNTFGALRYRFRYDNNDYYNAYGPLVGVELSNGPINIGIQYFWERFTEIKISDDKLQFYVNFWHGWDLLKK